VCVVLLVGGCGCVVWGGGWGGGAERERERTLVAGCYRAVEHMFVCECVYDYALSVCVHTRPPSMHACMHAYLLTNSVHVYKSVRVSLSLYT